MSYLPHGMCYLWNPFLVVLHVVSDIAIWLSYFVIPVVLFRMWYRHGVKRPKWVGWNLLMWFGAFIILCGTTHLMEVLLIWEPYYWLSGAIKAATALTSAMTVFELSKRATEFAVVVTTTEQLFKEQVALSATIRNLNKHLGVVVQ
jgi:two-component system NtrC family sensor kinase